MDCSCDIHQNRLFYIYIYIDAQRGPKYPNHRSRLCTRICVISLKMAAVCDVSDLRGFQRKFILFFLHLKIFIKKIRMKDFQGAGEGVELEKA